MRHAEPSATLTPREIAIPILVALAFSVCAAIGCRATAPEPRVIVLSEHCQSAAPGDTVPPLPAGEPRWWLCTPTGLRMMMPDDCDFPDVEEADKGD